MEAGVCVYEEGHNSYYNLKTDEEREAYLRNFLKSNSRSEKEIDLIFAHFLNGGMLSEIISGSETALESDNDELMMRSMQALQVLDRIIMNEKIHNPKFRDQLIENFLHKKSTE